MKLDSWETIIEYNGKAKQNLARVPEPSPVTDQEQSVNDYNRVMATNMTVNYSVLLDIVHRASQDRAKGNVLDLCSGPGHLSSCLAKFLNYQSVLGIDLSQPMVDIANRNAMYLGLSNRLNFQKGDVANLNQLPRKHFDLVSFTNSAHHFPNVESVEKVLLQAEKLVSTNGLIVLFDLARLKDQNATDAFVKLAGKDFKDRNMNSMYEDFKNSMNAAWLPTELANAIPQKSNRNWLQIIPRGLTSFQAIVGLPENQNELFLRDSFAWENTGLHQSDDAKNGWLFYRQLLASAEIRPGKNKMRKVS